MFGLTVHTLANVANICKDTLLVTFTVDGRRRDSVPLASGSKEGRVGSVEGGIKPGEKFLVGIVPIASKPRLGTLVHSSWGLTTIENIISKFSLINVIEVLPIRDVLLLVSIGVLALRFLQLFLKGFQVKGSLLLRSLFFLFQFREVEILWGTEGSRLYVGRRCGRAGALVALRQGSNISRPRQRDE